jgi:hypothetical protein
MTIELLEAYDLLQELKIQTVMRIGELSLPERKLGVMRTLKTIGWISVGLGAVAAGLLAGRELQKRYKFNRRTPYDYYAHAGDEYYSDMEFGVCV